MEVYVFLLHFFCDFLSHIFTRSDNKPLQQTWWDGDWNIPWWSTKRWAPQDSDLPTSLELALNVPNAAKEIEPQPPKAVAISTVSEPMVPKSVAVPTIPKPVVAEVVSIPEVSEPVVKKADVVPHVSEPESLKEASSIPTASEPVESGAIVIPSITEETILLEKMEDSEPTDVPLIPQVCFHSHFMTHTTLHTISEFNKIEKRT
jgi:hypothetical protein